MKAEERIEQQKHLVETLGRNYEEEGMQPVAGRIIALLMVMDREEYTFDDIVEELKISKSSASVALKMLQAGNIVEYITRPGDRKRYFRIKREDPFVLIDELKRKLTDKKQILAKILELKADPNSRNAKFFKDLIELTEFFLGKFEDLKKEYFHKR